MGRRPKDSDGQMIFNRLESARVGSGLSRAEFAEAVGVHYQTVGYLERGEYSPSLALALRISRLLHQPIDGLFSLEPFESPLPAPNSTPR